MSAPVQRLKPPSSSYGPSNSVILSILQVWALQMMQVAFDSSVTGKCASQAQGWLRKSMGLFRPDDTMFPGDEDNGRCGARRVRRWQ
jgi:hypothetical protein